MLESQGIFSLAVRSEATLTLARNVKLAQSHIRAQSAYQAGASLGGSGAAGVLDLMTNTSISPAAKLKAFLKDVLDKTDDKLITDDMLKRLEKASKSDNKEISAERLRQAKAKLQALRLQAQMAAASGDPKQLRRIAQEAAQATREVAAAVRGLAGGISATALAADGATVPSTAPQVANSTADAPVEAAAETPPPDGDQPQQSQPQTSGTGAPAPYTGPVPSGEDPEAWGRDALRKLSDDAHTAIAQARGLIAFCAQAARAARKHRPDPDEEKAYRDLQRMVSDADGDVDGAIGDANKEIAPDAAQAAASTADSGGSLGIESTTAVVQTTTVITIGVDTTV